MRHGKQYRRWGGPITRINILRNLLTGLVRFERIELTMAKAHELQKYAERIISVAKRGDKDPDGMRVADFWLNDKAQVHKLFKVLGPRYANTTGPFTKLYKVGEPAERGRMFAFLEYRWNAYPPLKPAEKRNPKWLVNVLLQGAHQDFHSSGLAQKLDRNITNDIRFQEVAEARPQDTVEDSANEDDSTNDGDSANEGTPV